MTFWIYLAFAAAYFVTLAFVVEAMFDIAADGMQVDELAERPRRRS